LLVKERAERDKQEKEALENLKMSLEIEKRKVEEDLKAERALALDKDALLERSKNRESELEDEMVALQADLDSLDSQLDRALRIQKASEEKYDSLREAFDEAAGHLVRLEGEQREWILKETELIERLGETNKEIEDARRDRDELQRLNGELKTLASQLEEDFLRTKERVDITTTELEVKLGVELRNRSFPLSKPLSDVI
jgi:myosin heavy chain 9/10/11/14